MNRTINDEIEDLIQFNLNQVNYPIRGKITKIHNETYIDVITNQGKIENTEYLGNTPEINSTCVIIFLNNDSQDYIALT